MKTFSQSNSTEAKQFSSKISECRDHNRQAEWINNIEKELKGLDVGSKTNMHLESLRATLQKYQIGKLLAMMTYIDSNLKNTPPSMTERLSK